MFIGRTVFAQLMDLLPLHEFRKCVARYRGEHKVVRFSCLDQFLCLAFAQLTGRESLRDIEACLRAVQPKLYHMGFRGRIARNTLANANERRDWRIYADLAQVLIGQARPLYADEDFGAELELTAYAFDSTTIDLCLDLFPWAHFRRRQGAIKLHTLLDLRGSIPTFIRLTPARVHDVNALDQLPLEPGAFYVFDRGYLDFARLYVFTQSAAFFVTRAKSNTQFQRRYSHRVDKSTGLRSDQTIVLTGVTSATDYPAPLRRIHYFDAEHGNDFVFLTNHAALPALTIARLYKARWRVELFFRWIKQHLHIKAFYGTSENAVKTQIWTAISVYVLVAILKKRLGLDLSLYTVLQILNLTLFEKTSISQILTNIPPEAPDSESAIQLQLFNL